MKALILMSFGAILLAGSAQANQTCREGQEEIWGEQNSSGEGEVRTIYVCKNGVFVKKFGAPDRYVPQYRGCKEGSLERFSRYMGGESDTWETYVCKNGKFVPLYGQEERYEAPRGCREGSHETFLESNSNGEGMDRVEYVCRHGRFVKVIR